MENTQFLVFKFGGASVKNADAVRNVGDILKRYSNRKLVVVISAMGKITNALEELHNARFHKHDPRPVLREIREFHEAIAADLFQNKSLDEHTQHLFDDLEDRVFQPCSQDFDMEYDQIVCYGELISTSIVNAWLTEQGFSSAWLDARQVVRTDARYRDARVDWTRSGAAAEQVKALAERKQVIIVQGFIGSTPTGQSTTLGREGSDFTAAIMAFLLDAESVTIWKDVPGMLNADPKWFKDTVKLDKISFREAIELAYYGASVIHPKTIKPLQNKGIPLYIKSFINPDAEGSVIQENDNYDKLVPSYIFRPKQVLVSFTPKDFSFVVEDNLRDIFDAMATLGIRINLMENSAISFSVCMDADEYKMNKLFELMQPQYQIRYNTELLLITVRHYDDKTIAMLTEDKEVILEQRSRSTVRLVAKQRPV
jgi:aspartate kinase